MLIDHYTGNFEAAAHNCCRNVNLYSIGERGFDDYPQPELDVEIKLDPSNIEAITERASFNLWLGDYDAASADLDALNAAGAPANVSRGIRDALHRAHQEPRGGHPRLHRTSRIPAGRQPPRPPPLRVPLHPEAEPTWKPDKPAPP